MSKILTTHEIAELYSDKTEPQITKLAFAGKFGDMISTDDTAGWDADKVKNYFENHIPTMDENIEALIKLGADVKIDRAGNTNLQNTFSTWIAYLKHTFNENLAVDVHDPIKLYNIIENTKHIFKVEELPAIEKMIRDLHDNYGVQASSLKQSQDAFHIASTNLMGDVDNQYNFFEEQLKRMEQVWIDEGKPEVVNDVFVKLFKLVDNDYNRAVGKDWLNGAIFNMTKSDREEPYIRSLDILDTEGGSGKSSFIEYSNALILGQPGKKSATLNFDVNNDFMYSMLIGVPFIHDAELRMSRRAAKGAGAEDEKGAAWKDFTAQPDYSFQQKGRNDTTNIAHYFTVIRSSNKTKVYGDIMANETERRFMPIIAHRQKSDMLFSGENWAEDYRNFLKLVWGEAYHNRTKPSTQMSDVIASGAQVLQQQGADGYVITDNLSNLLNVNVPPTLNSMQLVQASSILAALVIDGMAPGLIETPDWKPYSTFPVMKQNILVSAMKKIMQSAKLNITNQEKLTNMIDAYVTNYGFSPDAVHRDLTIDGKPRQQANYYEKIDTLSDLLKTTNELRDKIILHTQTHNMSATELDEVKEAFLKNVSELGTYGYSYAVDYLEVILGTI